MLVHVLRACEHQDANQANDPHYRQTYQESFNRRIRLLARHGEIAPTDLNPGQCLYPAGHEEHRQYRHQHRKYEENIYTRPTYLGVRFLTEQPPYDSHHPPY
jgi:hypothetical protein